MTLKNLVLQYLEKEPLFRERRNKDKGVVSLLMRRYPPLAEAIEKGVITKNIVTEIVQDYASMDRAWRQTLEHDPALRGSDYYDKVVLEQAKQIELGYRPGHNADVATIKRFSEQP